MIPLRRIWRSFASWTGLHSNVLVNQITRKQNIIFFQYFRDCCDQTFPYENKSLRTEIIKTEFIGECKQNVDWHEDSMAKRLLNILDQIEDKGSKGEICTTTLENDALDPGTSNLGYSEIENIRDFFSRQFRLHVQEILCLIFVFSLNVFFPFLCFLVPYNYYILLFGCPILLCFINILLFIYELLQKFKKNRQKSMLNLGLVFGNFINITSASYLVARLVDDDKILTNLEKEHQHTYFLVPDSISVFLFALSLNFLSSAFVIGLTYVLKFHQTKCGLIYCLNQIVICRSPYRYFIIGGTRKI